MSKFNNFILRIFSKAKIFLNAFAIAIIILIIIELSFRFYYHFLSSKEEQYNFALFTEDNLPEIKPRYIPHHYLTYINNPNYSDKTGKTNHNSMGFRGKREYSKKNPESIRIITIGGSTTYTSKVTDDEQTYPAFLEKILHSMTGSNRIEVINAGTNGYTTWESFINLSFRLIELEPDIIIVYHATNDLHARRVKSYNSDNSGYRRSWELKMNLPIEAIRYSYLLRRLALCTTGVKVLGLEHYTRRNDELINDPEESILVKNKPVYFDRNIRLITSLAKSFGCKVVLCTFASNPAFSEHYASTDFYKKGFLEMNRLLKEIARSKGAVCVDLNSLMSRDTDLWVDGVHLNEKGARIKAEIIAKVIINNGLIKKN